MLTATQVVWFTITICMKKMAWCHSFLGITILLLELSRQIMRMERLMTLFIIRFQLLMGIRTGRCSHGYCQMRNIPSFIMSIIRVLLMIFIPADIWRTWLILHMTWLKNMLKRIRRSSVRHLNLKKQLKPSDNLCFSDARA